MDFSDGKVVLLQAIALMNDEGELANKIVNIQDSIQKDKARTVTLFSQALALTKHEVDRKKKCLELLEEVAKWWQILVEDREKLLLTVSSLEMEKEDILRRYTDPREVYGPILEATLREKQRLSCSTQDQGINTDSPSYHP